MNYTSTSYDKLKTQCLAVASVVFQSAEDIFNSLDLRVKQVGSSLPFLFYLT
jgi:hypothetical protein